MNARIATPTAIALLPPLLGAGLGGLAGAIRRPRHIARRYCAASRRS